jgi:hypothetical protein
MEGRRAQAQVDSVVPLPCPISDLSPAPSMPSPTQQILDGINGTVYPISSLNASPAFHDAIHNLPNSGGELYVYPPLTPGTKYVFETSVTVRRSNVTMRFAPGTLLDFAPGSSASSIFFIPLRNFRCHSAHVQHSITAASTNRSIFFIQDRPLTQSSNTAAFYDCVFDIEQATTAPIESFSCIRAEGIDGRRGLLVHRSRFLFERSHRARGPRGIPWSSSETTSTTCSLPR